MDALSPHDPCETVVCKFASQTGKTEGVLNFLGYIMDQDPGPVLAIQPSEKPMGEAFSKDRIAPMIRDTPVLRRRVAKAKGRDSNNTLFHKTFPGGHVTIGGANSPAGLASRPIRFLLGDEIDRWETTKEGNALSLARKRLTSFSNRKELLTSSPTYEGIGIDAEFDRCSQQFERHLVCPDCGESQFPRLEHFRWPDARPEDVIYICTHCGTEHDTDREQRMKAQSIWVKTKDEGDRSKGYWMNQWCSPFASWSRTVREYLDAKEDLTKLQVVTNTALAECWRGGGAEAQPEALAERAIDYPEMTIPDGAGILVAGIDVQHDRLAIVLRAFGPGEESWLVSWQEIYGSTIDPRDQVWTALDTVLLGTVEHANGYPVAVTAASIDSSDGTTSDAVYAYVRTRQGRIPHLMAIKGGSQDYGRLEIFSRPKQSIDTRGRANTKASRYGLRPYVVGTHRAKDLLSARIQLEGDGPGRMHWPESVRADYYEQMTGEFKAPSRRLGGRRVWQRRPGQPVEAWDCEVYALHASRAARVHLMTKRQWDGLLGKIASYKRPADVAEAEKQTAPVRKRKKTGFASRWRT